MFRFIGIHPDGTIFCAAVGGNDVSQAFDEFRRYYGHVEIPSAIGVWRNHALVARVLPTYHAETERLTPRLEEFPI